MGGGGWRKGGEEVGREEGRERYLRGSFFLSVAEKPLTLSPLNDSTSTPSTFKREKRNKNIEG